MKLNHWVMIEFKDHCKDSENLVYSQCCGIVRRFNSEKVVISTWNCPFENKSIQKLNDELLTIDRRTIERWTYIEGEKWLKSENTNVKES